MIIYIYIIYICINNTSLRKRTDSYVLQLASLIMNSRWRSKACEIGEPSSFRYKYI